MPVPIPLLITAAATAVGVAGQIKAGRAARRAGREQQAILEHNAEIRRQEGEAIKRKAKFDAKVHAERVKSFLSAQRAQIGRSGVAVEGTPSAIIEDTIRMGKLDELAILYEGELGLSRAHAEAAGLRMQGRAYREQGRRLQTQSFFQAGGTLLSGGVRAFEALRIR